MKKLIFFLFFFTVLSLAFSNSLWARGGGGQGTSFGSGGGGGGGGGHFRGSSGPSHFGGGRGHFSGGHRHFGHHRHSRINFGFNFGGFYGPGFYGYPYWSRYRSPYYYSRAYVYPSPLIAPATPPVYIERKVTAVNSTQSQSSYWYYCRNPEGYYPYVKQCPEGWLQVVPQPAPQSP
ncbi:hypothetical protein [Nitrosomonas marina]|uniref:Uncharacterized protein n=1 Tax=Nitrosomonas marina TaxID=917 RepID=A0A1H8BDK8_9PROT|nr:hypothetical protein [Nitrosomonas marina]SEM81051.1 hypothetical protein SAMN05216325_102227 [Nitrosomonas marina]